MHVHVPRLAEHITVWQQLRIVQIVKTTTTMSSNFSCSVHHALSCTNAAIAHCLLTACHLLYGVQHHISFICPRWAWLQAGTLAC